MGGEAILKSTPYFIVKWVLNNKKMYFNEILASLLFENKGKFTKRVGYVNFPLLATMVPKCKFYLSDEVTGQYDTLL